MEEPVSTRHIRGQTLAELGREDLEAYGVEELEARIAALDTEIDRTRAQLGRKRASKAAADALFGGKV